MEETPGTSTCLTRSTNNPECDGARLWQPLLLFPVSSDACFSCKLGETKEENNISSYSVPALAIALTKSQLDISSSYPLVPEL